MSGKTSLLKPAMDVMKRLEENKLKAAVFGRYLALKALHRAAMIDGVDICTDDLEHAKTLFDIGQISKSTNGMDQIDLTLADGRTISIHQMVRADNDGELHKTDILREHLSTQDASIFAIAKTSDWATIDPFGGLNDAWSSHLRFPKSLFLRNLRRDPGLLMRLAYTEAELDVLGIEIITDSWDADGIVAKLTMGEFRSYLMKGLGSTFPAPYGKALLDWGLLYYHLPGVAEMVDTKAGDFYPKDTSVWNHTLLALTHSSEPDPIVRFAILLHDIGKPLTKDNGFRAHDIIGAQKAREICSILEFGDEESHKIYLAVKHHMMQLGTKVTTDRLLEVAGGDFETAMFILDVISANRKAMRAHGVNLAPSYDGTYEFLINLLSKQVGDRERKPVTSAELEISGHEIMEHLDIGPGPIVGVIIRQLVAYIESEPSVNNAEDLLALAEQSYNSVKHQQDLIAR